MHFVHFLIIIIISSHELGPNNSMFLRALQLYAVGSEEFDVFRLLTVWGEHYGPPDRSLEAQLKQAPQAKDIFCER